MNLPMYIPGYSASLIKPLLGIRDIHLTSDMIKQATTLDLYKKMLTDNIPNVILNENIDSAVFNHNGTGVSVKYSTQRNISGTLVDHILASTPIWTLNDIPKPKSIYISCTYSDSTNSLGSIYLMFTGNISNENYIPLSYFDASRNTGSNSSIGIYTDIHNRGIRRTSTSGTVSYTVSDFDTYCPYSFTSEDDTSYMFRYYQPHQHTHTSSPYTTTNNPVYLNELHIQF